MGSLEGAEEGESLGISPLAAEGDSGELGETGGILGGFEEEESGGPLFEGGANAREEGWGRGSGEGPEADGGVAFGGDLIGGRGEDAGIAEGAQGIGEEVAGGGWGGGALGGLGSGWVEGDEGGALRE
jgi:hypothetical protein